MEKKIFRSILFALIAVLTLFGLTLPMATPVRADDPSIWTDKADYTLGETVTISGSGFVAKTEVTVTVQRPDQTPETADIVSPPVISDEAGSFTCTYQLDGIEGTCLVTATDGINTVTTFIDVTQIYIEATQVDGVYTSDSGGTLDSTFDTSDDVWAVIDGGGSGDPISVRIYVIAFTSYSNGDTLTDLSSDGYETKSITNSDVNGPYKIWPANTSAGTYYVYVNKNLNGQYHSNERKYSFTISAADTIAPIVDIAVSDTLINEADDGGTFDVIATFSEAMDTTATPTISFDGDVETSGTLTFASDAWSEGDTVYTATYDVADVDEEVADVDVSVGGAKDVAGNFQDPDPTTKVDLFDVDTIAPSVTIEQAGGQADPTNASPIDFKVVFSESVADFATGDVALDGTAGADTAAVTGSGTDYDVAVSGMTTDGTVIASIADGG